MFLSNHKSSELGIKLNRQKSIRLSLRLCKPSKQFQNVKHITKLKPRTILIILGGTISFPLGPLV